VIPVEKLDFILVFIVDVNTVGCGSSHKTELVGIEPTPEDNWFVDLGGLELLLWVETPDLYLLVFVREGLLLGQQTCFHQF